MFIPKRTKYRKQMKGRSRLRLFSNKGAVISFGTYGLKAQGPAWLTSNQLEACRRILIRYIRKTGKMWIRIFPGKVITRKGAEVPMGGGRVIQIIMLQWLNQEEFYLSLKVFQKLRQEKHLENVEINFQ